LVESNQQREGRLEIKQRKLPKPETYDKRASRGMRFQTHQYTGCCAIAPNVLGVFGRIGLV
jgi:hypothetical protein